MHASQAKPHFPHLFRPLKIGTLELRNRTTSPPHASAIGNIYGSEDEALQNIAYFDARASAGLAWVGALSTLLGNHLIPGFDPTGVGATTHGFFRLPWFVERIQQFSDAMHRHGTRVTVQMVHQGGMPHAPSPVMSAPVINLMPHVMDQADIDAFIREYAASARLAAEGRADGVEIHLNHDDLHEWFLSPVTNQRSDRYGGSLENRCRFTREVLQAIREAVGDNFTVGVRMNLREEHPRGYQVEGAIQIAQYLESTGLIDYVHGVVGNPWGNPSYIQPDYFQPAQWSQLAGQLRRAIALPVVYTGKVNSPEVAESVLASGHADVVGLARAIIADGDLIAKAERGESDQVRPCIGCNECISRRYVEGIPFSCTVNPTAGQERWRPARTDRAQRRLLVVGGGPAGLELAASMAEAGVQVTLWEAEGQLGGQLRYAMQAPGNHRYTEYLDWQTRRLDRLGVELQTGFRADAAEVLDRDADWVAFATGASARRPNIPGVDQDGVLEARDVLAGHAQPGQRVAIVAQDDHLPPLLLADFLSERGHEVTLIYGTNGPAQLIGRYTLGAIMGRLDARDVTIHTMQEVTAIGDHSLSLRHVYSTRERDLGPWDSIVLACGGVSVTEPYNSVKTQRDGVHVLGDAYAPRRAVFATRQAHALARSLLS